MKPVRRARPSAVLLALLLCATVARAQEVGVVTTLEGRGEVGRNGTWTAAAPGTAILQGDELRTGRPARLRIVLRDDSVVTLADESHLVVDEQVFNPSQGQARSFMQLLRGKVETLVNEYYGKPGTTFEIKTKTAVAGVRGTDYVVVYDENGETTDVVGVSGHIEVHGVRDLTGHGVFLTAREVTTVARGGIPSPVRRLDDSQLRQYLDGFDFRSAGQSESLTINNPVLAGSSVPGGDLAQALPPPPVTRPIQPHGAGMSSGATAPDRDASTLLHAPPSAVEPVSGRVRIHLF